MNQPLATQFSAMDIAQAIFEVLGDAVVAADFETFSSLFQVPLQMAQGSKNVTVKDNDDLHVLFMRRHNRLKDLGATLLVRACVSASFETPLRILATHVGHVVKDNERLSEPQPIYTVIEKIGGDWKITANECAVFINDEDANPTEK